MTLLDNHKGYKLPRYPQYVDEHIIQPVAITIFVFTLLTVVSSGYNFIIYLIFLDFLLRYIHPKFSPHTHFHKILIYSVLKNKNEPKRKLSGPNRFSILIGVVMSGFMSLCLLLNLNQIYIALAIFLLIASGLQGIYGYCLGCTMHCYLINLGIIKSKRELAN